MEYPICFLIVRLLSCVNGIIAQIFAHFNIVPVVFCREKKSGQQKESINDLNKSGNNIFIEGKTAKPFFITSVADTVF